MFLLITFFFMQLDLSADEMAGSEKDKHQITEHEAECTHNETRLDHILLLEHTR